MCHRRAQQGQRQGKAYLYWAGRRGCRRRLPGLPWGRRRATCSEVPSRRRGRERDGYSDVIVGANGNTNNRARLTCTWAGRRGFKRPRVDFCGEADGTASALRDDGRGCERGWILRCRLASYSNGSWRGKVYLYLAGRPGFRRPRRGRPRGGRQPTVSAWPGDGRRYEWGRILRRRHRSVAQHQLQGQGVPLTLAGRRAPRLLPWSAAGRPRQYFGSAVRPPDVNGDDSPTYHPAYGFASSKAKAYVYWAGRRASRPVPGSAPGERRSTLSAGRSQRRGI